MSITKTPFSSQCYILGTIWAYYRKEGEFFESYTDLYDITLPIARAISQAYLDADMLPEHTGSFLDGYGLEQ